MCLDTGSPDLLQGYQNCSRAVRFVRHPGQTPSQRSGTVVPSINQKGNTEGSQQGQATRYLQRFWWSRWDSNPRPPRCHRGALPTAPRPHRKHLLMLVFIPPHAPAVKPVRPVHNTPANSPSMDRTPYAPPSSALTLEPGIAHRETRLHCTQDYPYPIPHSSGAHRLLPPATLASALERYSLQRQPGE